MIRARILDRPNTRSSHQRPIPRSGGVAIVVTTYVGLLSVLILTSRLAAIETQLLGICIGASIVAAAGFFDDLNILNRFQFKLLLQALACIAALASGVVIERMGLPFIGNVQLGWWGYPITLLWLLGLTNIVNFMDGLDGLAAGTAAIVAAVFGLVALEQGGDFAPIIGLVLFTACAGFFVFNFPRARIFMGDVGSQFLGFALAALAVLAAGYESMPVSVFAIPLLFFHFIFDTVFTFFRRMLVRENVTQAHRSHLYQLLNQIGWSHAQVSLLHFGMTIAQGMGVLTLTMVPAADQGLIFLPFLAFQTVYAIAVLRRANKRGVL